MSYRITGLSPELFRHLFGLSDAELAAHGAQRWTATPGSRLPDRIELRDAEPGRRSAMRCRRTRASPRPG